MGILSYKHSDLHEAGQPFLARYRSGMWVASDYSHIYAVDGSQVRGIFDCFPPHGRVFSDFRDAFKYVKYALNEPPTGPLEENDQDIIERLRRLAQPFFGVEVERNSVPLPECSPLTFLQLLGT